MTRLRWLPYMLVFVAGFMFAGFTRYFRYRLYSWGYTAVFIAAIVVLLIIMFKGRNHGKHRG